MTTFERGIRPRIEIDQEAKPEANTEDLAPTGIVFNRSKGTSVEFRVVTADELAAEDEITRSGRSLSYYFGGDNPVTNDTWKNNFRIPTGQEVYAAVGASTIVATASQERKFAISGDRLGIFIALDQEAGERMGDFFEGFTGTAIKLTQKIYDSLYNNRGFAATVNDEREGTLERDEIWTLRAAQMRDGGIPSDDQVKRFLAFSSLVTELVGMVDLSPEEKRKQMVIPRKERAYKLRDFKRKAPSTTRFEVDNRKTNMSMEMLVVGLPDTKYEGRGLHRFNGITPEEALVYMHEDARGRNLEDIHESVKKASDTMVPPHVEFTLFQLDETGRGKDKEPVSRIYGWPVLDDSGIMTLALKAEGFDLEESFTLVSRSNRTKEVPDAYLKDQLQEISEKFAKLSVI